MRQMVEVYPNWGGNVLVFVGMWAWRDGFGLFAGWGLERFASVEFASVGKLGEFWHEKPLVVMRRGLASFLIEECCCGRMRFRRWRASLGWKRALYGFATYARSEFRARIGRIFRRIIFGEARSFWRDGTGMERVLDILVRAAAGDGYLECETWEVLFLLLSGISCMLNSCCA